MNFIFRRLAVDYVRRPINRLNLVYPYYMQGQMFEEQQRRWRAFPSDVLNRLRFIIVDDGSPEKPALDFLLDGDTPLKIEIYKIDVDKPWNQDGAQNLGALFCINEWIFLSDMDRFLPLESIRKIFALRASRSEYFKFNGLLAESGWRDLSELKPTTPHKNSYLIHWDLYWKVGGRDEYFSGLYSMCWIFRHRLKKMGRQRMLDAYVVEYSNKVVRDSNTKARRTDRKERRRLRNALKSDRKFWKRLPEDSLLFPWHKEYPQGSISGGRGLGRESLTDLNDQINSARELR